MADGRPPGTRARAVAPSSKLVLAQRCANIFRRWDLPLPKKPLTHTESCREAPSFAK